MTDFAGNRHYVKITDAVVGGSLHKDEGRFEDVFSVLVAALDIADSTRHGAYAGETRKNKQVFIDPLNMQYVGGGLVVPDKFYVYLRTRLEKLLEFPLIKKLCHPAFPPVSDFTLSMLSPET